MNDTKDKFKLVNPNRDEDEYLVPEVEDQEFKQEVKQEIEREKNAKKKKRKKYFKIALIFLVVDVVLVGFGLLWQWEISLMAIGDALWLAFAIELTVAWIMFVYNHNILSPLIHGVKTFGLMIVGKRPKMDYYNYMKKIEDDPIPNFYYIVTFISAGVLLIPALIILFILI